MWYPGTDKRRKRNFELTVDFVHIKHDKTGQNIAGGI